MTDVETNADLIEVERRCYQETGNPLHVWAAYGLARVVKTPPPEWVLAYFDGVGRNLFTVAAVHLNGKAANVPAEIMVALGMKPPGKSGSGTAFSRYHKDWLSFGMNVRARMQSGEQQTYAIEEVAKQSGVSEKLVRDGWKRYNRLFPGPGIFPDEAL
ncbi:MAG: hypothetical protein RLO51_16780 [Thalassobaculum sp.]|uniref:hypothetical protein n=1 Tax=Thalassobaculum sp. TaxID=2022740 RepID=UPI0032EAEE7F